jgi:hypothetical protein
VGDVLNVRAVKPVARGRVRAAVFTDFLFPQVFEERGHVRDRCTFLFPALFCSSFFGVMSYKSIYYSMCSVFKCNLRKKRKKNEKKYEMEFDLMHG